MIKRCPDSNEKCSKNKQIRWFKFETIGYIVASFITSLCSDECKKWLWKNGYVTCSVNIYRARKFALPRTHQIDLSWSFTCAHTQFFQDQTFINNQKLWFNLVGFVLYLHLLKAKLETKIETINLYLNKRWMFEQVNLYKLGSQTQFTCCVFALFHFLLPS